MKEPENAISTAGAAIVVDCDGYIAGWNEGAEVVLGYSAREVIGRACHHVLCGRKPDGELVCHPWCTLSPATSHDTPDPELVLYPRSASRELLRLVLSVFRIAGDDPMRGWVMHSITSAKLLPARPRVASAEDFAWLTRRHAGKPKPPDTKDH